VERFWRIEKQEDGKFVLIIAGRRLENLTRQQTAGLGDMMNAHEDKVRDDLKFRIRDLLGASSDDD